MDIRPVDILAQRQDFWIARPTLKAIDQEQSLATVHHAIAGSSAARSPPISSLGFCPYFRCHSSRLSTAQLAVLSLDMGV